LTHIGMGHQSAMKVLAFTPAYLPVVGGIEVLVDMLAQSLRAKSIETVVVTDADKFGLLPHEDTINGTRVYRLDFFKSMLPSDVVRPLEVLRRLGEICASEQPDVIHMHSAAQPGAWHLARLLKKLPLRPPLMITQHGLLEAEDRLSVALELLRNADAITAVSDAVRQSAVTFAGPRVVCTVIPNGTLVPEDVMRTEPRHGPAKLLCVGRLHQQKGFDVAIAALAKVRAQGLDAALTLIGQGAARKQLQAMAASCGIGDHVEFLGVLDRRRALEIIAGCTALLVPARSHEGFGLVVAEAAFIGVPCVASRIGGLPEVVEDGVTGLIVAPGDPDALACAVTELLRDPDRARVLGKNARIRARQKFNIETCVDRYLTLYNQVVDKDRLVQGRSGVGSALLRR
jgi:glycogen synthase